MRDEDNDGHGQPQRQQQDRQRHLRQLPHPGKVVQEAIGLGSLTYFIILCHADAMHWGNLYLACT